VRRDDRRDPEEIDVTSLSKALAKQFVTSVVFVAVLACTPLDNVERALFWPIVLGVSAVLHGLRPTFVQPRQELDLWDLSRIATLHFMTSVIVAVSALLLVSNPWPEVVIVGPLVFGTSAISIRLLVKLAESTLPRARAIGSRRRSP